MAAGQLAVLSELQVQFSGQGQPEGEGEAMVRQLQQTAQGVDEKLGTSQIQLFQGSAPVPADFGTQAHPDHALLPHGPVLGSLGQA